MSEAKVKVKLLSSTENAAKVIYAACRQCYSSSYAGNIYDKETPKEKQTAFIKKIVASGHESTLEHVSFSFAVEGISRACSHQLVRHRLASYSQQSQRYVNAKNFRYICPPSLKKDDKIYKLFTDCMHDLNKQYENIMNLLEKSEICGEKAQEDARFILPNAIETKIVITMNARELLHFFKLRCCTRAQWEIRDMSNKMLKICKENLPEVFENAGAACEKLKYCPEGEKFCCGRYPTKF